MTDDPRDAQAAAPATPLPRVAPHREFLTLAVHGNAIYAVSQNQGELFPLYVYGPLQEALLLPKPDAPPLAPAWEPYVRDFVQRYKPLPALNSDRLPLQLRGDVRQQLRTGDPNGPQSQATYRLWPLYYVRPGLCPTDPPDHPFLFQPAALSLKPLYGQDEDGQGPVTFPPPTLGP